MGHLTIQMLIYLDTNAFIAAVEGPEEEQARDALWRLFALSEERDGFLVTSELSLAEVLVKPLEMGLSKVTAAYCDLIQNGNGLVLAPIDRGILLLAAALRASDKSIKLPDAIHLATAERQGCSTILTDDRQMTARRPNLCRAVSAANIDFLVRELS